MSPLTLMPHQRTGGAFLAPRPFALLLDDMGLGKAQPLDCMVMTPVGPVRMGDIKVGDLVIGLTGAATRVVGVYPQGIKPVWRVHFSDGTSTRCTTNHLWAVNSHNRLNRGLTDWKVMSLQDIMYPTDVRIKRPIVESCNGRYRWKIPVARMVDFIKQELPLDSYVLGCLLGDGHIKQKYSISVCGNDSDMFDEIKNRLKRFNLCFRIEKQALNRGAAMYLCGYKNGVTPVTNPLVKILRDLGLTGCGSFTKFIPLAYLTSDIGDRLDLLRGLLDTDGYVSKDNFVSFGSRSKALATGVAFLARSLGAVVRENLQTKTSMPFYSVTIQMSESLNPFFIARKAAKWKPRPKYKAQKAIRAITPEPDQVCQCIQVASADGLYLTDDFIVTHNTVTAVHGADLAGCQKILILCPAAVRPHWARSVAAWQQIDRPITVLTELPKTPPGDGVTIASHDALARAPATLRAGAPYDLIIVDEVHQMRDWNAFRTKCLYQPEDIQFVNPRGQIETRHVGAWSWAPRLWCLTGTPVVNSAVDLWPIFYGALRQDITWYDFAQRFCEKLIPSGSGDQNKPVGLKNAVELAERMRPFTLRRTLDSVGIALPPLSTHMQGFDLPQAVMTEIMAGLEDWSPQRLITALENADTLTDANLMRVRRVLGLAKCPAVAHWVWDAIANRGCGPVVVFYWHQDVQAQLHRVLHGECGFRVATIQGKTTPKQLAEVEMQFQDGQFEVLLAQIQSAGQGLTLHRSNTCVTAESPWTAMALQQAFKRISRIGQARPCTATVLTVNGMWLEDVMGNIINRKQQASESLLQLLTSAA